MKVLILLPLFFVSAALADNPLDILKDYFSITRNFTGSSTKATSFTCKLPKKDLNRTILSFEFR